jgi:hypothetical protein
VPTWSTTPARLALTPGWAPDRPTPVAIVQGGTVMEPLRGRATVGDEIGLQGAGLGVVFRDEYRPEERREIHIPFRHTASKSTIVHSSGLGSRA